MDVIRLGFEQDLARFAKAIKSNRKEEPTPFERNEKSSYKQWKR